MRIDWALKKGFGWITAVLIAIAAYFQAAGIAHLVGGAVAVGADDSPLPPSPRARSIAAETFDHSTAAATILARNPFDSITGPLVGDAVPQGPGEPPPALRDIGPCETARVVLISASDDPSWSFASISAEGGRGMLRRVGDAVGGFSVESIARDRVRLTSKQIRCEAVLGAQVAAPPPPPPPPGAAPGAAPGGSTGVPPEIASRIRQTGERSFVMQRGALDAIMARQAELFGRLRIAPDKDGLRVAGIRPESLLGRFGLQNGDHLQRINGFDIADPHSALEAYSKLMSADHLVITTTRGGKSLNYDMKIE
jgi:general secretion pathway protein C